MSRTFFHLKINPEASSLQRPQDTKDATARDSTRAVQGSRRPYQRAVILPTVDVSPDPRDLRRSPSPTSMSSHIHRCCRFAWTVCLHKAEQALHNLRLTHSSPMLISISNKETPGEKVQVMSIPSNAAQML
ncbi:hypothetical protein KMI_20g20030 [Encephalitozoon hellem]|nr:hypothetical protein KMI_20g20030 [Encephalitozoon hellem]